MLKDIENYVCFFFYQNVCFEIKKFDAIIFGGGGGGGGLLIDWLVASPSHQTPLIMWD